MNNRLQFRHHSEIFETRELAIEYIMGSLNGDAVQNYSLYAEPTILRYKNEEDESNPHVILAIGADTNTSDPTQYSMNRFCIIDIDKNEADIESLFEKIEEVIDMINIITIDSNTIELHSEVTEEGIKLSGNTKLAENAIFDSVVRENIILETENGLFTFVNLAYDENSETFTFTVNGDTSEFRIYNDYVISGSYMIEDESIHLKRRYGDEMVISLENLIDEWKVEGSASTTPVVLTREKIGYGEGEGHEHAKQWQDILRGDVRISSDEDNILEKDDNGQSLLVRGTADNIKYGDETVESKLDRCKISTDSDNNIIFKENDGIFASITLDYDPATNTLILRASNQEEKEIKLNGVEFLNDISYDSEREVIVIRYKDSNGELQRIEIPAKDIIEEWETENNGHNVELERTRVTDGKDQLSADVKISSAEDNILEDIDHSLFVKGTADNIKYYDDVTVRDALDGLRGDVSSLSSATDEIMSEIEELSSSTEGKLDDIDNGWKVEDEIRDMSISIDKTDPSVPLIKVQLSEDEDNILSTEDDGVLAIAKMSYDAEENTITFTNTKGSEVFHLESGNQIRQIFYDKSTEEIVIQYEVDHEEREARVPMGDLIEEWEVDNVNKSVKLTRTRVTSSNPDRLSADVNVSADEDNILERIHEVIGGEEVYALKVSNEGIVQNAEDIADLQSLTESMLTTISGLNDVNIEQDRSIEEIREMIGDGFGPNSTVRDEIESLSELADGKIASITNVDHAISIDNTDETNPVLGVNLSSEEDHGMGNIIRKNIDGLYAGVSLTYDAATNSLTFSTTNTSQVLRMTSNSIIDKIYYDSSSESIVVEYTVNGNRMPDVLIPVSGLITEWETVNTTTLSLTRTRSVPGPDTLSGSVILDMNHTDNILVAESGLYVPGSQISANTQAISQLQTSTDGLLELINGEIDRSTSEDESLQEQIDELKNISIHDIEDTDTVDLTVTLKDIGIKELTADVNIANEDDNILVVKAKDPYAGKTGGLYVSGALICANTEAIDELIGNTEELSDKIDDLRDYVDEKLGSGFTDENSANTVTQVIEDIEETVAEALNDLNSRLDNIGDVITDYITNIVGEGFCGKTITEVILDNEEVTSTALNDLNSRLIVGEEFDIYVSEAIDSLNSRIENIGDTINESITNIIGDGFSGQTITQVIIDNELVISAALNDLDNRIRDLELFDEEVSSIIENINTSINNFGDTFNEYVENVIGEGFCGQTITDVVLEDELVISTALNDLNSRIKDIEEAIGDFYTKDEINQILENIDVNDAIDERLGSSFTGPYSSVTVTEMFNEYNNILQNFDTYVNGIASGITAEIEDNELVISTALNDLNGRILEIWSVIDRMGVDINTMISSIGDMYTKEEIDSMLGPTFGGDNPVSSVTDAYNYLYQLIEEGTGGIVDAYSKTQIDDVLGTGFTVTNVTKTVTQAIDEINESLSNIGDTVSEYVTNIVGDGFCGQTLTEVIADNELTTSAALNDLNLRIHELELADTQLSEGIQALIDRTPDAYTKAESNRQLGPRFSGTPVSSITEVINELEISVGDCLTVADFEDKLGTGLTGAYSSKTVTEAINEVSATVTQLANNSYTKAELDATFGNAFQVSTAITSSVTDYIEMISFLNSAAYNDLLAKWQQLEARVQQLEANP